MFVEALSTPYLSHTVLFIFHNSIIINLRVTSTNAGAKSESYPSKCRILSDIRKIILSLPTISGHLPRKATAVSNKRTEPMKKDTDRRVKYTKSVLKQSLLQLMLDRDIGKITVKDICERADINRSTFYTHFTNPSDLLLSIEDDLLHEIQKSFDRFVDVQNIPDLIIALIRAIVSNDELCKNILSSHGDKEFLKRAMDLPRQKFIAAWKQQFPNATQSELETAFLFNVNGSIAVIQDWIEGGMKESPDNIARFLQRISFYGLWSFTAKKKA